MVCLSRMNPPPHLTGFLFHFVKERGYTQGTKVNKGHCSCAAINSLPFFIWTEIKADRVILTHSPSAHLITDKNLVWSLLLPFPVATLGAIVWFLFQSPILSPYHSPKSVTVLLEDSHMGRGPEDGYTCEIRPMGKGKRVPRWAFTIMCPFEISTFLFLAMSMYSFCHIS